MRFMVMVKATKDSEAGVLPSEKLLAEMGKYNEELAKAGVSVEYQIQREDYAAVLSTRIEAGTPPDIAIIPGIGFLRAFVATDDIVPLADMGITLEDIEDRYASGMLDAGIVDGELYAVMVKLNSKATVWYRPDVLNEEGLSTPDTWDEMLQLTDDLRAAGWDSPWALGAADDWTLTDWFENVYLRSAGPEMHDQLANHEIPWTDQSVKDALTEMGKILSDTDNIAGRTAGALQTDFPTSVSNVFAEDPKAAIVIEGDFVPGVVESPLKPETGFNVFQFPSFGDEPASVVGGGDTVVMFKDSPAAQALIRYLTTEDAARRWAEKGGFASLNKELDASVYPDPVTQTTAGALAEAEVFRFDLSDLQPAAFGGTVGQGLFKLFQDFLRNPQNVDGIAQQMETAAAKAFGG